MGDETAPAVLPAPPSVLDSFRGNKVWGRLLTCELPSPPPKLLTRKPGRCSEPLEIAQKAYEEKSFLDKLLTPKDAWGNPKDQLAPKLFKQQCEQWPDQLPESFVDEQQQRLNDHLSGRISLPPEESLRLRRDLSLINDMYRPGPRYEAALSAAEQAWLDERNLRFGNSLSMALLGPVFGGPAAVTRALGGTEQQVAAANQMGAIVLDLATTRMAVDGMRPVSTSPYSHGQTLARGAPLEPISRSIGAPSVGKPAQANAWAPKKPGAEPIVTVSVGTMITKPPPFISPEMEAKILYGQRVLAANGNPTNRVIGAHSGQISDKNPKYAVEVISTNPDGTRSVKLVTQFSDGNLSKLKNSTLFPESWSDADVMSAVRQTAATPSLATRALDGASLHQSMINGVHVEVISVGGNVTAGYPCGSGCTSPGSF